jgi:hypothetical protein
VRQLAQQFGGMAILFSAASRLRLMIERLTLHAGDVLGIRVRDGNRSGYASDTLRGKMCGWHSAVLIDTICRDGAHREGCGDNRAGPLKA